MTVTKAILRLNDKDVRDMPVTDTDKEVTFSYNLTAGSHRLAPLFITPTGEVGAYYVIVTKQ
jgi:arylsulfatase B